MPVVGLPAALEGTLEVLLMENQCLHGKFPVSDGSKTVVVLHSETMTRTHSYTAENISTA